RQPFPRDDCGLEGPFQQHVSSEDTAGREGEGYRTSPTALTPITETFDNG
ncbi:unnamed protein product, partial [Scytosiphon promiscuus]